METWKKIENYPDYYISDFGTLKSIKFGKEKIIKLNPNKDGYLQATLHNNGIIRTKRIHQLVAIAFLNHNPNGNKIVVNHKDFNKQNNNLKNLEIISHRENCNKKHLKSSSKYTGVFWSNSYKKWIASIMINGKQKRLGYFDKEYLASQAYQTELFYLSKI